MPNITVNTTSTSFGLLPADLSRSSSWLSQYLAPTTTVYQAQNNVFSTLISIANAINSELAVNGYSSAFLSANELQVNSGPFTLDYFGTFSSSSSIVTKVTLYGSGGLFASETGNLVYAGIPPVAGLEVGSTLTSATALVPNPGSTSSNVIGGALLSVTWNGSYWGGNTSGFFSAISDTTNNKEYQVNILENPSPISFGTTTPTAASFLNLVSPTVDGVGIVVGDYTTGINSDTVLATGVSYAANSVPVSQAFQTALAGNDTVSISGSGSLNIIPALTNASSVTLSDSALNVVANLDQLETLALQGKLSSITLTDPGTPLLTVTAAEKTNDAQALNAISSPHSVVVPNSGIVGNLNVNQQLELIYVAYFNRAADSAGFTFWQQQLSQAESQGQSAAVALTNVANSFAPQSETEALYPSLDPYVGTSNPPPLSTAAGQTALSSFLNGVYQNLFGHAPDSAGQSYWVGQLTSGAVGLGAAALAIANGATGTDATTVMNKITAAIGTTPGASATTAVGSLPGSGSLVAAPSTTPVGSTDPTVISVSESNKLIDPGVGSFTIQFLAGTSGDTLVLHTGGVDQVSGFDPSSDVLDLRSLLSEANVNLNGSVAALGNYLTVTDQGTNALLSFDPTGHGGGSTIAVLMGLGGTVTGLNTLIADGAIRIG